VQDLALDRKPLIAWMNEEKPDIVFNNAGFGVYGAVAKQNTDTLLELFRVDGEALTEISIEAIKMWKAHQIPGTLFNISSASAFLPLPNMAIYAATKAYVNSFSLSLNQEVARDNIRVLVSCPGMVDTPFSERASGKHRRKPTMLTLTTDEVVESIFHQIERGTPIVIVDWRYRFLIFFASLFPKKWIGRFVRQFVARGK
jgi:uncharacterized protein